MSIRAITPAFTASSYALLSPSQVFQHTPKTSLLSLPSLHLLSGQNPHRRNVWLVKDISLPGPIFLYLCLVCSPCILPNLHPQVAISSQRGAQSGGLVSLVESAPGDPEDCGSRVGGRRRATIDGIRSRCAPGKRDHLSVQLHRRFGRALGHAPRLACGHGIFAGKCIACTAGYLKLLLWRPPCGRPRW